MARNGLAPIAIFAFRRPDHLLRTLTAIERCSEFSDSPIFVFSDGPKSSETEKDVAQVRALLRERTHPNMNIVESSVNLGLATSIISGVTQLCSEFGRVIVIEDDLVVSPCALAWFNQALDKYLPSEDVFHINAFQYRVPEFEDRREAIFSRFVGSWGWATWQRAWQYFDREAHGWEELSTNLSLRRDFDQNNSFPLSDMLVGQMTGKLDSWAIRWFWTVYKKSGLCLSPPRALLKNIGFDEKATHNSIGRFKRFTAPAMSLPWQFNYPPTLPKHIEVLMSDERALQKALRRTGALRNARIKKMLAALTKKMHRFEQRGSL